MRQSRERTNEWKNGEIWNCFVETKVMSIHLSIHLVHTR